MFFAFEKYKGYIFNIISAQNFLQASRDDIFEISKINNKNNNPFHYFE